jgi:molybdate transport system substrate-binding protein
MDIHRSIGNMARIRCPGRFALACVCASVVAHLGARPLRVPSDEVLLSAAASLNDALTEIARGYEAASGVHVALNFGSSSGLARQIVNGAPVDLFLSADEAQMDAVAKAGALDPATRVDLLANQLVIIMPAGAAHIDSPRALTTSTIRRIALANPDAVPAGVYAKRYLTSLGLWDVVAPKVVPTLDVRAALAAVDAGNADAAFVYRTDAAIARGAVTVFSVPLADGPRIVYPAAQMRAAPHPAAARALLTYLRGPAARAVFERYGFMPADAR